MEKVLKVGSSPIKCYPNYGSVFTILDTYTKEYVPWIYNHFVQLILPNNHAWKMRMDFAPPNVLFIPWLITGFVSRKLVKNKWKTVSQFLQDYVEADNYIYALFDVSCIKAYGKEKNNHLQHEVLIYGYDSEKCLFYYMDNYDHGAYKSGVATYEEINNASSSIESNALQDWISGFVCLSYREVYDYGMYDIKDYYIHKFNIELYKNLFNDYLCGNPSYYRWQMSPAYIQHSTIVSNNIWGINVYDYIIDDLNINNGIDLRPFAVLVEHKRILKNTYTYLISENLINRRKNIQMLEVLEDNIRASNVILNMVLKVRIDRTREIKEKSNIRTYLSKMKENDKKYFNLFLENNANFRWN